MSNTETSYSTDEFGRANDRDYHYRIHLDDSRAMRKARIAEKIMGRIIHWSPNDMKEMDVFPYVCLKTTDNKGHIPGLAKHAFSPDWEDFPAGPGRLEGLRMRSHNKGGTKIQGETYVGHDLSNYVEINTTVEQTPTEVKAAWNNDTEDRESILCAIDWAEREAVDKLREDYENARQKALQNCDHNDVEERFRGRIFCHCCLFEFASDEIEM